MHAKMVQQFYGILTAIMIALALTASILVLPALLTLVSTGDSGLSGDA